MAATLSALSGQALADSVIKAFDRKRALSFAIPGLILAYLIYAAISFDLPGLAARARWDNAQSSV